MILYVEHTVDANDLTVSLWRFCNNLDPRRDHFIIRKAIVIMIPVNTTPVLVLMEQLKQKNLMIFIVTGQILLLPMMQPLNQLMKNGTSLGLGEFISSPSLKFKDQMYGEEAVAAKSNKKRS